MKATREVSNSTPEADRGNFEEQGGGDGWISWAWNSVLGEEEDELDTGGEVIEKAPPVVGIGIHVKECTILLKLGSSRSSDNELGLRLSGIGTELTIKGRANTRKAL